MAAIASCSIDLSDDDDDDVSSSYDRVAGDNSGDGVDRSSSDTELDTTVMRLLVLVVEVATDDEEVVSAGSIEEK